MKNRRKAAIQAGCVSGQKTDQLSPSASLTPTVMETCILSRNTSSVDHPPDVGDKPCIYRMARVIQVTGLSRSSIYRLEAEDLFPKRVKLGFSASGWRREEVHAWVTSRPRAVTVKMK